MYKQIPGPIRITRTHHMHTLKNLICTYNNAFMWWQATPAASRAKPPLEEAAHAATTDQSQGSSQTPKQERRGGVDY